MSMFHGKAGKVVWNAEDGTTDVDIQHVQSWSVEAQADVAEATEMGTTYWKQYIGGFKGWTGSIECNADSGGPDISLTSNESTTAGNEQGFGDTWEDTDAPRKIFVEFWFTQTAGDGILYGPAICNSMSMSVDKDDVAKVTYSLQGNGELYYQTTEPADFVEPLGD